MKTKHARFSIKINQAIVVLGATIVLGLGGIMTANHLSRDSGPDEMQATFIKR